MSHTPGPWTLNGWDIVQRDCGDDFPPLATACNGNKTLTLEVIGANARLIATAPELLDALRLAVDLLSDYSGDEASDLESLRAVIAKAEGGGE